MTTFGQLVPRPGVFEICWRFAAERHRILLRRFAGDLPPWTDKIRAMSEFLRGRADEADAVARREPGNRQAGHVIREGEMLRQLLARCEYCKKLGGVEGNEALDHAAEEYEDWVLPLAAATYYGDPDFRETWIATKRTRIWPEAAGTLAAAGDPRPWRPRAAAISLRPAAALQHRGADPLGRETRLGPASAGRP